MNGTNKLLVGIGIVVVIVVILVMSFVGMKNRLIQLDQNQKAAWSQVDVSLQRRLDLIPNLVETVKGYATHEEKVLTEVTKARASVAGASSVQDKINTNNQLTGALSRLLVVVEQYPNLKANENFMALQDELAGTENRIAVARQRYNEAAQVFNTTRLKIPYSFFSAGFKEAPYYTAAPEAGTAPKVKF